MGDPSTPADQRQRGNARLRVLVTCSEGAISRVHGNAAEVAHFADPAPCEVGDFSGIAVDPRDGTFWAGNEYAKSGVAPLPLVGWGTWIAHFSLSGGGAASTAARAGSAVEEQTL